MIVAQTSIGLRNRELPAYSRWLVIGVLVFTLSCCVTVVGKGSPDAGRPLCCCQLSIADRSHPRGLIVPAAGLIDETSLRSQLV